MAPPSAPRGTAKATIRRLAVGLWATDPVVMTAHLEILGNVAVSKVSTYSPGQGVHARTSVAPPEGVADDQDRSKIPLNASGDRVLHIDMLSLGETIWMQRPELDECWQKMPQGSPLTPETLNANTDAAFSAPTAISGAVWSAETLRGRMPFWSVIAMMPLAGSYQALPLDAEYPDVPVEVMELGSGAFRVDVAGKDVNAAVRSSGAEVPLRNLVAIGGADLIVEFGIGKPALLTKPTEVATQSGGACRAPSDPSTGVAS